MNNEYKIAITFLCLGLILANVIGIADYRHGWDDAKNDSKYQESINNQTPDYSKVNITQYQDMKYQSDVNHEYHE